MERLHLDYRRTPLYAWMGKAILGAGVLAIAGAISVYWHFAGMQARQEVQRVPAVSAIPPAKPIDPKQNEALQYANQLAVLLSSPWETLFQAVEASTDADVAILKMESEAQQRALKLSLEARDYDAMMHYVERLEAIDFLTKVQLLNHQEKTDDPQRPIRFEVSALWGHHVK